MTTDGGDRFLGAPRFDVVLRGYDRRQVDEHLARTQRVIMRLRADLEIARSQQPPPPPVTPGRGLPGQHGGGRPHPGPPPWGPAQQQRPPVPGPDVIGGFTERMQAILRAAEEEAAEIRRKARLTAQDDGRLRAQVADLVGQRDAMLAELNRLRGRLDGLTAPPRDESAPPVEAPPTAAGAAGSAVDVPAVDVPATTAPPVPAPRPPRPSPSPRAADPRPRSATEVGTDDRPGAVPAGPRPVPDRPGVVHGMRPPGFRPFGVSTEDGDSEPAALFQPHQGAAPPRDDVESTVAVAAVRPRATEPNPTEPNPAEPRPTEPGSAAAAETEPGVIEQAAAVQEVSTAGGSSTEVTVAAKAVGPGSDRPDQDAEPVTPPGVERSTHYGQPAVMSNGRGRNGTRVPRDSARADGGT